MVKTGIDCVMLKKMFLAGAKNLEAKKEWINELNVFPVPDGDTGINMTLTIMSAVKEISAIDNLTMEAVSKAISSGSLRGARGNSGVILSQLLRGFTKVIRKVEIIDARVFAEAFGTAVETAYKAVMKPKEGTILTVAKGMADKASEMSAVTNDLDEIFKAVIEHGDYVLGRTPDMLPVLKQANVVDSGGQGLMQIMKGAYDAFCGKATDFTLESAGKDGSSGAAETKFKYRAEFIVTSGRNYNDKSDKEFKEYLKIIGDAVLTVSGRVIRVCIYTDEPGKAIQKALSYGTLTEIKISTKRVDSTDKSPDPAEKKQPHMAESTVTMPAQPKKEYGFVSVSIGDGLNEIFRGLTVDSIIEGGQTMNPSTEDIINAVAGVNAANVFVLPNNANIILAAEQAAQLIKDKKVIVVPSKTIPQGITAVINFISGNTPEDNLKCMKEEMSKIKTGQVTYAVRDTVIGDKTIKENDIMGMGDGDILAVGKDVGGTAIELIKALIDDDSEIVSIYYGAEVTAEDAGTVADAISGEYPNLDVEVNEGGQPIYYYIISVE